MNKVEQEFLKDLDKKLWSVADKLRNNTQIPACIWFLTKDKSKKASPLERGLRGVFDGVTHSGDGSNNSPLEGVPPVVLFRRGGRGVDKASELTNHPNKILFIDAREKGYMKDRVLRDFKEEEIKEIAKTDHN